MGEAHIIARTNMGMTSPRLAMHDPRPSLWTLFKMGPTLSPSLSLSSLSLSLSLPPHSSTSIYTCTFTTFPAKPPISCKCTR
jgi:hypothetical protein